MKLKAKKVKEISENTNIYRVDENSQELKSIGSIAEAQKSNTPFEQDNDEKHVFKKEDDKSFKEDRINLEEILNNTGKRKKDYIRKVVKTVNQMIDGKKDVTNLINVVKRGKK